MPMLIRWRGAAAQAVEDPFAHVTDDAPIPSGPVILDWTRFQAEGARLDRPAEAVGVRLAPEDEVETLAPVLTGLGLIALPFAKFRDGRSYSAARILRERMGWRGELRAVGEVVVDQARFMVRCGFDAFEPSDGSSPAQWTAATHRFRYVYQRASDGREPAFVEREKVA